MLSTVQLSLEWNTTHFGWGGHREKTPDGKEQLHPSPQHERSTHGSACGEQKQAPASWQDAGRRRLRIRKYADRPRLRKSRLSSTLTPCAFAHARSCSADRAPAKRSEPAFRGARPNIDARGLVERLRSGERIIARQASNHHTAVRRLQRRCAHQVPPPHRRPPTQARQAAQRR